MGALRPVHIILLVIVILLLFGARRLPELARSVGQSLKIFKNEVKDLTDDGKSDDPAAGAGDPHSTGASPNVPGAIDPNKPQG